MQQISIIEIGQNTEESPGELRRLAVVMFWPFDPAKNAIQGDAPEGSDTF